MFPLVLLKKLTPAPTLLILICQITTGFLLCFLFLSCTGPAAAFSEAFLVRFESNSTHPSKSQVQISAGFISICSRGNSSVICVGRANTTALGQVEADTGAPIRMATKFSNNIVNPVPVCGAFLFTIVSLAATLWNSLTFMPFRIIAHRTGLICTLIACIFWFLGAVWLQVAIDSVRDIINSSEVHDLQVRAGHRAGGMTWCAFTLLFIASALSAWTYRKDVMLSQRIQGKLDSV